MTTLDSQHQVALFFAERGLVPLVNVDGNSHHLHAGTMYGDHDQSLCCDGPAGGRRSLGAKRPATGVELLAPLCRRCLASHLTRVLSAVLNTLNRRES
jgi:hypothetical protein